MSKRLSFSVAINLLTDNFRKGTKTVKDSFRSMQMQILTFATALGAGGLGLSGLLSRFKDVARETSRVTTALKNVSVGTSGFADNLKFINDLANKYGLEVNALTANFARFTASASQANMPMEEQKKIFESVSRAITAFGLSAVESDGVMLALSQMMSKGKVSMEELRKQMGEKLPIAVQAMAKALGVPISEMEKLIGTGKVMSAEILPKFADALNDMIPNVDTDNLETSLSRLSNAFGDIVNASGFQNSYKSLIDGLTTALKVAGENIKNIVIGIFAVIAFGVSNMLSKVYQNYANTGQQIIAQEEVTSRKMRASVEAYTQAKKRLSDLELQHATANGQRRIALERKIQEAKTQLATRTAQARMAISDRVTARENANSIRTAGAFGNLGAMITGTAKKIGVAIKGAFASFGFGLLIAGITTVIAKMYELLTATTATEDAMADYNKEVAIESKNLNSLFDSYKKANEGSKEKDRLLQSIKDKYGQYIQHLIDEKGHIKDINEAQKLANLSLQQSIALKIKDATINKVNTEKLTQQGETLSKIRKTISSEKGDDKANEITAKLGAILSDEKKTKDESINEALKYIESEGVNKYAQSSGLFGKTITGLIREVGARSEDLKNEVKDIKNSFSGLIGDFEDVESSVDETKFRSYGEQVELARKKISSLKNELSNLRSGKTESNDYVKDITEATKQLKDAEDNYNILIGGSNSGKRSKSDTTNKRNDAYEWLLDKQRELNNEQIKEQLEFDQKMLDLEQDSFDKQLKQIGLNQRKELLSISDFANAKLKEQKEVAKKIFESENGNDEGFNFDNFDKAKLPIGLRDEDISNQIIKLNELAKESQLKGLSDLNRDLSAMLDEQELLYSSSLDKRLAEADIYYNDLLIKAGDNAKLIDQIEKNRAREKQSITTDETIKKLDFEEQYRLEKIAGMESIGMVELVENKKLETTKKYIQLRIDALQELANMGDEEAIKQISIYEASLKKLDLEKPAKSLKSLADKAIFDTIKKGFQSVTKDADKAEFKTINLLGTISDKASTVAAIVSELVGLFSGLDESLDMALETVGNIAQGFATGGIVGGAMAVVGEGMRLFSKASEAAARHQQALEDIQQARLASQRAYNLLLREQNLLLEEARSIFGEKDITIATNSILNYRDALQAVKDEIRGEEPIYEKPKNPFNIESSIKEYQKQKDAYDKGTRGLYNARIVTGHKKTGMFGWGKGKDTYSSILDVYPKLIDAENNLDKEMLQTIITTEKMDDATKSYLQNILDLYDQAESAQESLRSYLESTFGSLGNDLMTSIESAIVDSGVNAWEKFGEAGSKVIEQLGKQIAYELFFAEKFKTLQSQLETVYGSGKDETTIANDAMDLVGNFYQNIGSQMELAQGFMENWQKQAEKYNLDLWSSTQQSQTQTPSSKGFESMSQDTGNRLDGRFASLQMSGIKIESILSSLSLNNVNVSNTAISINSELQKQTALFQEMKTIHLNNYYEIEGTSKSLKSIESKLNEIGINTDRL